MCIRDRGVTEAVKNINIEICKAAASSNTIDQSRIDSMLINLDGTDNKSRLGAVSYTHLDVYKRQD